ncbi:MAG: leucine--tRNA ligase [Defluviitaleaceae bacterium]|nr:leucine--tRNA ligase [Defluviitaleaceae bacterium]
MKYNHVEIENKWRKNWEDNPVNVDDGTKPKFYCLDMFPYPSATGLHVGHWRGYVLSDVLARYKMLQGFYVLHPMGWDAFGLPAENYAIKIGRHPKPTTDENVAAFKKQLQGISAVYDWSREVNTTDPGFYKWTQWIFLKMFEHGLAYEKEMPLNWCPSCKCVLANEEAASGQCERCQAVTTKKMQRQWMLRITNYADRLLEDIAKLDWPEKVKKMQADWIGKSYGAQLSFRVDGTDKQITVYTTRPDTLYGATFMTIAPESELVAQVTTEAQRAKVDEYVLTAGAKSAVDRQADRDKTGVFTGSCCVNPANGELMQIWVADYVLVDYGTGAIMGVPAHDQRDFEFASKFGLPIVNVIESEETKGKTSLIESYLGDGVFVNSPRWNGLDVAGAKEAAIAFAEEEGFGMRTVNYRLRDWVFSRQRYWGEPIPVIHCEHCGVVGVPENDLPVPLPDVEAYEPTDTGESPLAAIDEWVNVPCPKCGAPAKRETNTMPQWAGSSWYFLRYADPHNDEVLASKEALRKWLPVDYYVGGVEHAVLHLLYARFYTKFLYDIGAVEFEEPFKRLFNQGMILKNGAKMSKSEGNVVSPDGLIEKYGCDSLRMYELFVGPPEVDSEWDDSGIDGVYRFLNRLWKLVAEQWDKPAAPTAESEFLRNKMIYDITSRLDNLRLNTVVSGFMEYSNKLGELTRAQGGVDRKVFEDMITMLSPFAPHISEELWQRTGHAGSVFAGAWPTYDEAKLAQDSVEIALQINGKVRDTLDISVDNPKEDVLAQAREKLAAKLEGVSILKEVYVPGKIVNFVVKG